jgi:hypothetical protein
MRFQPGMLSVASLLSLSLVTAHGCAGARSAGDMCALHDLQDADPAHIRSQAKACDGGDMAACNRIGVWFTVGGAGEERKGRGLDWFRHACRNRYEPACRMATDLSRPEPPAR